MKIDFLAPGRRPTGPLSPDLIRTGVAGTEEAYINVSQGLAALGHQVTVYADCRDLAGRRDGVEWRDLDAFAAWTGADVFITSDLGPLFERPLTQSARVYLWMHVHHDVRAVTQAGDRWNKLIVLSDYSRRAYADIPDERIFVSRNGVDPAHFDQPSVTRTPYRLAYGSDYDRGLSVLLHRWPQIRQIHPEATLNVFYGWDMFDMKLASLRRQGEPDALKWAKMREEITAGLAQDGVTHLGRIGHREVAAEFLAAEVWAYPCVFPETSCITAMKAQAGGAIPVVFPTAALRETVRFGARTVFDPLEREDIALQLGEAWFEGLLKVMADRSGQETVRGEMMQVARRVFSWSTLAQEWAAEFAAA